MRGGEGQSLLVRVNCVKSGEAGRTEKKRAKKGLGGPAASVLMLSFNPEQRNSSRD